jgi:hypothetical protein
MKVLEMRRLENVFFQHREALVDDYALQSYGLQELDTSHPRFREWWVDQDWRSALHPYSASFLENRPGGAP